jgi:predicted restriction endonuclease
MNDKQLQKEWREKFRKQVFARDGNSCKICGKKDDLDVHYITNQQEMPNGGCVMNNGIALCPKHRLDADKFHMTKGVNWVIGFHPNNLYKLIQSSHEDAMKDCLKLS